MKCLTLLALCIILGVKTRSTNSLSISVSFPIEFPCQVVLLFDMPTMPIMPVEGNLLLFCYHMWTVKSNLMETATSLINSPFSHTANPPINRNFVRSIQYLSLDLGVSLRYDYSNVESSIRRKCTWIYWEPVWSFRIQCVF